MKNIGYSNDCILLQVSKLSFSINDNISLSHIK